MCNWICPGGKLGMVGKEVGNAKCPGKKLEVIGRVGG